MPATQEQIAHDTACIQALHGVRFGHFNQNTSFLQSIKADGVKTPRQRWWLNTLVVRHRKQLQPQHRGTLTAAEKWLRENQEPEHGQRKRTPHPDDRTTPMSRSADAADQDGSTHAGSHDANSTLFP